MKEIWRNPERYKSYFKGGWYITGDRAHMDEDGYFWFIGKWVMSSKQLESAHRTL